MAEDACGQARPVEVADVLPQRHGPKTKMTYDSIVFDDFWDEETVYEVLADGGPVPPVEQKAGGLPHQGHGQGNGEAVFAGGGEK